jgi:type I restriction enzyme S subunit
MDRKAPQGTQKNINIEFLMPWPVKVPPPTEQAYIASILNAIDKKMWQMQLEIDLLKELFRALLEELMSGQLSTVPLIDAGLSA